MLHSPEFTSTSLTVGNQAAGRVACPTMLLSTSSSHKRPNRLKMMFVVFTGPLLVLCSSYPMLKLTEVFVVSEPVCW
jgi:hypothetical protein